MKQVRHILRNFILLAVAFFAINYSWTHAALAGIATTSQCPKNLIIDANHAVGDFFGASQSSPIFLCINEPTLGLNISYGTTRFAPFLPTIVILGPNGQNIDVASHEFAHAEIAARTSALLRTYRMPTWFDEGVAMQLDHRNQYSEAALQINLEKSGKAAPRLNSLERPSQFYEKGRRSEVHYAYSRCILKYWLLDNGSENLSKTIANTSWIQAFPSEQFSAYRSRCQYQN